MKNYPNLNPETLKELSKDELPKLAEDIRKEIILSTSLNGGHLSSNLGVVELTIAMMRAFDLSKDEILFDVGHQSYTYKLLTGRSLDNLRTRQGVSGFQSEKESPYDHFQSGHSSTSISIALGKAIARDLNTEEGHEIIAFIGDSSLVNGLSLEALNSLSSLKNHKVIIVLNDNDMSISKPVGGIAKILSKIRRSTFYDKTARGYRHVLVKTRLGKHIYESTRSFKNRIKHFFLPPTIFDAFSLNYIGPINGHKFDDLEKAFNKAKKATGTIVIHVQTVKGKGYKYAENDKSGSYHGVVPFDIESGKFLKSEANYSSFLASSLLLKLMRKDEKTVLITPATLKGSSLETIFKEFPERSIDVGIAEEHAVTLASGLSSASFHPIISIYSTFLQRGYDEISHDLARMNAKALILIDRAGLVGADGATHQGIYDEGMLLTIPHLHIATPLSLASLEFLFENPFGLDGPLAIRLPKTDFVNELPNPTPLLGKAFYELKKGNEEDILIVVGPKGLELSELFSKSKITILGALFQTDYEELLPLFKNAKKIYLYQPYATVNGFTSSFTNFLMKNGYRGEIKTKALKMDFIPYGTIAEQEEDEGVSIHQAYEDITNYFNLLA